MRIKNSVIKLFEAKLGAKLNRKVEYVKGSKKLLTHQHFIKLRIDGCTFELERYLPSVGIRSRPYVTCVQCQGTYSALTISSELVSTVSEEMFDYITGKSVT